MLLGVLFLCRIKQKTTMIGKKSFNSGFIRCTQDYNKPGNISARFIMEFGGGNGPGLACKGVLAFIIQDRNGGRRYSS